MNKTVLSLLVFIANVQISAIDNNQLTPGKVKQNFNPYLRNSFTIIGVLYFINHVSRQVVPATPQSPQTKVLPDCKGKPEKAQ